jgi:DNA-binding transcriptional regulator YiaG
MLLVNKEELRDLRQGMKMTQREFAEMIGVESNTVARWESGVLLITRTMAFLFDLLKEKHGTQKEEVQNKWHASESEEENG